MINRLVLLMTIAAVASDVDAALITFFPTSNYSSNTATMDAALGVTGFTIENFEDTTLISGLSITYTGNSFNETRTSLTQTQGTGVQTWDGSFSVNNHPDNIAPINTPNLPTLISFEFAQGASSVGIGLAGFQSLSAPSGEFPATDHLLYINGVAQSQTLESLAGANFTPSRLGRNTYLRIDAVGNEVINSIGFENITRRSAEDFLQFDHLAVNAQVAPVPEPSSIAIWIIGFGFVAGFHLWRSLRTAPLAV